MIKKELIFIIFLLISSVYAKELEQGKLTINNNVIPPIYECKEEQLLGDASGNGEITSFDASLISQYIAELVKFDNIRCADVNCDNKITQEDSELIQKYKARLIDRFPCFSKIEEIKVTPGYGLAGTIFSITAKVIGILKNNPQINIKNINEDKIFSIALFDDGTHGDKNKDDKFYGNLWDSTDQLDGEYVIEIIVEDKLGNIIKSEEAAKFSISTTKCVTVIKNGDPIDKINVVFVPDEYMTKDDLETFAFSHLPDHIGMTRKMRCDLDQNYYFGGSVLASTNTGVTGKDTCKNWCSNRGDCKSCWWNAKDGGCVCGSENRIKSHDWQSFAGNCISIGILSREPFLSNADRFNFYYVMVSNNFNCKEYKNWDSCSNDAVNLVTKNCPFFDQIIVLVNSEEHIGFGVYSKKVAVSPSKGYYVEMITSHEFGHTFGGLADEYNNIFPYSDTYRPNCDNYGCQKWCSGTPQIPEPPWGICSIADTKKDEEKCRNNPACDWFISDKSCFLRNGEYGDFSEGLNCIEGTGCYHNCYGVNGFRSSENSIMRALDSNEFNLISKKHINNIFKCCYPNNASEWDSIFCTKWNLDNYQRYASCTFGYRR